MKLPIKLLLPASLGDSLLIEPKSKKVYFKVICNNKGFIVCTDKYKLREIFELSDSKNMKPIRPHKLKDSLQRKVKIKEEGEEK